MVESLKLLISRAGHTAARNVIESQLVYPKTESIIDAKAILNSSFNGSLKSVVLEIQSNIELRALDAVKDCLPVLNLVEEFKESVLLDRADYLVTYKGGFDIFRR